MTSRLFPTGLPAATACMSDAFQSVYRKKQQRAERISAASPISLQNHRHMGAPYPFVRGQPHSTRRSGGGGYLPEGERKSVVKGRRVSDSVNLGGRRMSKKKKTD